MKQFEFQHIYMLSGLTLIPVFILLYLAARALRRRMIRRFGDANITVSLMPDVSNVRPALKFSLYLTAFGLMILVLANLRSGSEIEKKKRNGIDLVIALDLSNSMLAEDIQPSRLARARMAVDKLCEKLGDDQIALVGFAGRAQVLLPLTPDIAALKMVLHDCGTDIFSVQGTALGAAIETSARSFNHEGHNKKAIIIISDGENHEDDAVSAAREAASKGIVIHTIGMGSPAGAPIPVKKENGYTEYKKDADGKTIISKLNEAMLTEIAVAGGGQYVRATTADAGLDKIYEALSKLEKNEYEADVFTEYEDLFPYFAAAALLFLIIEFMIMERRTRISAFISKIKSKRILMP